MAEGGAQNYNTFSEILTKIIYGTILDLIIFFPPQKTDLHLS